MKNITSLACLGLALLTFPATAQKSTHRRSSGARLAVASPARLPEATAAAPAFASAQKILSLEEENYIGSYRMSVGFQKTTHLIFPYAVSYVDLGNGGIIADKAQGAENIVRVKASQQQGFPQTNMTVVTTDGRLYSFIVDYEASPRVLNYNLAASEVSNASAVIPLARLSNQSLTQTQLEDYSHQVLTYTGGLRRRKAKDNITLALQGMYTQNDVFFFPLHMANSSNISYDVDFVKFYIRDKKVAKRTAIQETELTPLFVYNAGETKIPGPGKMAQVYALNKFTIPDDKYLVVEMFEKGGGRHLFFNLTNRDILKARKLNQ
ncbi:conjugative transposon protein TraN (plasmid) [Hymenobacter sp. NBH84]|uniref:conjugative transposon protein TraN n=1 Tax=Hymenobacter sp. NBH84 TaxID=2596915 RepID=UPI001627A432|nr:conjugative transposon protein TraN [Hymenobacter sp. NBH84]QNE42224.1 conjugative transposon protein TraN [Hymenobacter sp. NBH84]